MTLSPDFGKEVGIGDIWLGLAARAAAVGTGRGTRLQLIEPPVELPPVALRRAKKKESPELRAGSERPSL